MADDTSGPEGGESLDVHLDLSATVNDILGRSLIVSAHATHVQWGGASRGDLVDQVWILIE